MRNTTQETPHQRWYSNTAIFSDKNMSIKMGSNHLMTNILIYNIRIARLPPTPLTHLFSTPIIGDSPSRSEMVELLLSSILLGRWIKLSMLFYVPDWLDISKSDTTPDWNQLKTNPHYIVSWVGLESNELQFAFCHREVYAQTVAVGPLVATVYFHGHSLRFLLGLTF